MWKVATPRYSLRLPVSRLLIDTGNAGSAASRDAGRIMEAVKDAGLQQIDHLIITHWHGDHFGGMAELASRHPDPRVHRSRPERPAGQAADTFLQKTYPQLYANAKHTVVKAGDRIPMAGLDVRVVTSAGETIKTALPGAGKPNPYCANFKPGESNAEDPQSVGVYMAFGKFRTVHLGDLTKNKEFELMCPNNLHRHRRCAFGIASRAGQLEFRGAGARASSSRGHHE